MQRPMVVPPNVFSRNDMPGKSMKDPKVAMRRLFRGSRSAFVARLSMGERERLEGDLAAIVAPLLGGDRVIASYAAVGAEIDPCGIEGAIPRMVAFPRVTGRDMAFHVAARAGLRPRTLGIPEPDAGAPQVTASLLLVPLLAVTPAGIRLGQGGGYYDRMLQTLRGNGRVTAIGIAWDVQVVDTLPREPWDELLDWVATPTRLVDCRKGR